MARPAVGDMRAVNQRDRVRSKIRVDPRPVEICVIRVPLKICVIRVSLRKSIRVNE
jgi:hypothetical protein